MTSHNPLTQDSVEEAVAHGTRDAQGLDCSTKPYKLWYIRNPCGSPEASFSGKLETLRVVGVERDARRASSCKAEQRFRQDL